MEYALQYAVCTPTFSQWWRGECLYIIWLFLIILLLKPMIVDIWLFIQTNLWAMVSTVQPANASWGKIWGNRRKYLFFQPPCRVGNWYFISVQYKALHFSFVWINTLLIVDCYWGPRKRWHKAFLSLLDSNLYCALDGVVRLHVHRRCGFVQEKDLVPKGCIVHMTWCYISMSMDGDSNRKEGRM